ncbi:MAG: hypothetical protein CMF25_04580 [Kangiellaceae bacterium]|jgi:hypothetical protein|nr:hypothetical protein [Kangiellaceae bacterium]|tara:strand:+ start:3239 stop:3436 length:198 start_codon:yes stop_codon:yes gene_type:complete
MSDPVESLESVDSLLKAKVAEGIFRSYEDAVTEFKLWLHKKEVEQHEREDSVVGTIDDTMRSEDA